MIYFLLIWFLFGFILLGLRLRLDDHFGGWMLMLSDPRHGTTAICVLIAAILISFPPAHIFIRR